MLKQFLGSKRSVSGKIWQFFDSDSSEHKDVSLEYFYEKILRNRKISPDHAQDFLNPTLSALLPDPFVLHGMQEAIEITIKALKANAKIGVMGDYDVDGTTASALLVNYFKQLKNPYIEDQTDQQNHKSIEVSIPNRVDGYGPTSYALGKMKGIELCFMLDCGTSSGSLHEEANKAGVNVIVIDHHEAERPPLHDSKSDTQVAVVNPNIIDEKGYKAQQLEHANSCNSKSYKDFKNMCASALTFCFLAGLNKAIRQDIESQNGSCSPHALPKIKELLHFVALGTVCDVMPMLGVNRAFVRHGLNLFNKGNIGLGLKALMASIDSQPPYDENFLGFELGPRLNSAGRLDSAKKSFSLLVCSNQEEAKILAYELDSLNGKRKEIQERVLLEAEKQALEIIEKYGDRKILVLSNKQWHLGVVGIIAARIRDKFQVPTLVMGQKEDGLLQGSGRSGNDFDLGSFIRKALDKGLLETGGGHALAVGLTIKEENLELLKNFAHAFDIENDKGLIEFDMLLSQMAINSGFLKEALEKIRPFGKDNKEPLFVILFSLITKVDLVKDRHLKIFIQDIRATAWIFFGAHGALHEALSKSMSEGKRLHLLVSISYSNWNDKQYTNLYIKDLAYVD